MKRGFYIILVMMALACATVKYEGARSVFLDFRDCGPDLGYTSIKLTIPEKYKLTKVVDDHGFCEYRFRYQNEMTLYISSNVYNGSVLNYKNRLAADVKTYSENRSINEIIKNSGREDDGQYWMEWIKENYVLGYVNYPDSVDVQDLFQDITLLD